MAVNAGACTPALIRVGLHDIDYRINFLEAEEDALAGNAHGQNTRKLVFCLSTSKPVLR